jgi:hypothetical protein
MIYIYIYLNFDCGSKKKIKKKDDRNYSYFCVMEIESSFGVSFGVSTRFQLRF